MRRQRPVGSATRGTTHPNRLRRIDRWLVATQGWRLREVADPVVVDLGFGARPTTTLELAERLHRVNPRARVVGVEIDPERVAAAQPLSRPGVSFRVGGFEVPGDEPVTVIRAANVLRQYPHGAVADAWARMIARLTDRGLVVDATCDEVGRLCSWVTVEPPGPQSLTVSLNLRVLQSPSEVAARLPKVLIHRNVPGERVHAWLRALDDAWERQAPTAAFGTRQRFAAAVHALREAGWPVRDGPRRWRQGEVTVDWTSVAPAVQSERRSGPPPGPAGQRA